LGRSVSFVPSGTTPSLIASHFTLWLGERKPEIELRFRRFPLEELKEFIAKDMQKYLPEGALAHSDLGNVRPALCDHILKTCPDSDGTLPLVDIIRARFYAPDGQFVQVTENGIKAPSAGQLIGCDSINNTTGFDLLPRT
jgi:hypothetical protein